MTARELFTEVMRDVVALCKFREAHYIQRGVWDAQIPADIRQRFIQWDYVKVQPYIVYLTLSGLEVLEYSETRPIGA